MELFLVYIRWGRAGNAQVPSVLNPGLLLEHKLLGDLASHTLFKMKAREKKKCKLKWGVRGGGVGFVCSASNKLQPEDGSEGKKG